MDLLFSNDNEELVRRYGNGNGTFSAAVSNDIASTPAFVASNDLNNDGILDIVLGYLPNNFQVPLGNSDSSGRRNNLLQSYDLTNIQGARAALTDTKKLLDKISAELGNLGAQQSRLAAANNNLVTRKENYQAAESRISDTDIAADSAELVRTNILQQAGAAVLAQANQQPRIALQLLQ